MNTPFPIRDPTDDPTYIELLHVALEAQEALELAEAEQEQALNNRQLHPYEPEPNQRVKRAQAAFISAHDNLFEAVRRLDAYASRPATGPGTVISMGAPASSGLAPVVATAPAFAPPLLPPGRVAPKLVPDHKPRASERKRKGPMTIPFVGWTIHRPNLKTALVAAALILGAGFIVAIGWAFMFGPLRGPTIDTSKATTTTGTPGDGSGGVANGGVIIDLDTCTVKNEDGSTSSIENCTPAGAVDSMDPYTQPSPGLNDNDVVEVPGECGVIHEYPLEGLPEVATSGNFIHVEHYDASKPGDPEVESVLDHARYGVNGFLKGYVWEYSIECSLDEVMARVDAQIKARQDADENNAGLASQEVTDARFSFIDDNGIPWGSFDPNRANPDSPKCQVMKEYPLAGRSKLSTEGAFIHVEHYIGGEPERESILSGDSTWKVEDGAKGFVWEYGKACKWGQVRDQITRHIKARLADHANNAGWIAWNNPAINGRFTAVR